MRLNFYYFIVGCLLAMWSGELRAQSVTVDAQIDSLEILIGDQTKLRLQVSLDADKKAIFPVYQDTLVAGVEIVDIAKPDTQLLNGGKRMMLTREYTLTSFDSALYFLPPMEVTVDSKLYRSQPLALKVFSIPVDTLHPDQFFGPKPVTDAPFVWSDWYVAMACGLLFIPGVLLLIYLISCIRSNKPIIRKIKVEPKLPPHVVAMKEMERIKSEKSWQKGDQKAYYTELTDVLRNYIKERFGFNATEMTSSEIMEHLLECKDKEAVKELKELFMTADLVKFAKHNPLMNENDANLLCAIDFIDETKQEPDPNAKPEPTEITIVEKRSLLSKVSLGAGVVVLVILLIWAVVYMVEELYNYFA
ncbi:MAG: hypothetical protein ACI4C3_01395 [Bacteroides sp.]